MARDLVSGGLFFVAVSFLAFTTSSFLPLWWFQSTELEGQQCSCATGLWTGNITWGDDLTEAHIYGGSLECSSDVEYMLIGCDAKYEGQEETRTKGYISGVFSLLSVLFSIISFAFGYVALVHHRDEGVDLDVITFRKGLCWASLSALVSIFTEVTTISLFMSSPLFTDLGERFGCNFVFDHALNSNPLKCGALGPSFGLAIGGCIVSLIACILFYLAFKNPHYIDPSTGRYSMFQEALLGQRPLDMKLHNEGDEEAIGLSASAEAYQRLAGDEEDNEISADKPVGFCSGSAQSPSTLKHLACLAVPTLLILNAALFVWSNCSTGATVEPTVRITFPKSLKWIAHQFFPDHVDADGNVSFKDDVFNFTLFTSLRHFWQGDAYMLAFLIGVLSGIWPYVKIFTMIILWFVPATEKLRGKMLHWLDVLGKWSLVDAYVLCLMAVAFGFNTDKEILGINIHVAIYVRPGWGVFSFVIGTMISLLMSHYMTYIHRHAMEAREISPEVEKAMDRPPHETLSNRAYAPFPRRRRLACSRFGRLLVMTVLIGTLAITLTGQLIHSFKFQFSGLADLILPVEKRTTSYSLVSLGTLLPDAASRGGFLSGGNWAWFITIMYFAFAMVVPLAMIIGLTVLFFVPMTLQTTKKVFHFCQFVQAWAALDVFLISIIAAVIEIGGLSQAVLGDAFGDIQDEVCALLTTLVKYVPGWLLDDIFKAIGLSSLTDEVEDCALFRVDAILVEGCWMLLFGVVAWAFCTHTIMEFADASIEERTMILKVLCAEGKANSEDEHDPYILLRMHSLSAMLTPPEPGRQPGHTTGETTVEGQLDTVEDSESTSASPGEAQQQQHHVAFAPVVQEHENNRVFDTLTSLDSNIGESRSSLVQSVYMKKILIGQEEGARRFMGTYFGDCMYGPFPRESWRWLCKMGIVKKVDWDKVGFDLHAALLMNRFAETEDHRRRNSSAAGEHDLGLGGETWSPRSPYADASSVEGISQIALSN